MLSPAYLRVSYTDSMNKLYLCLIYSIDVWLQGMLSSVSIFIDLDKECDVLTSNLLEIMNNIGAKQMNEKYIFLFYSKNVYF